MEFFYISCYGVCYVKVAYFGHFPASGADHVALFGAEAFLVLRFAAELMVYYKIGVYEQCYCVVHGRTAYSELLLLDHVAEKPVNVKATAYGVYGLEYGKALGGPAASVLFQIVCEYLFGRLCNLAVFHLLHVAAGKRLGAPCSFNRQSYYFIYNMV